MSAIDALRRRVMNLIGRAVVTLVTDTESRQVVQITLRDGEFFKEKRDRAERFLDYGFSSHPQPGAEALVVFPAGSRGHAIVIAVDDRRYRKTDLQPGEVAVFTDEGDCLHFTRGQIAKLTAGTKVLITAPLVEVSDDVIVHGAVNVEEPYQVGGTQVVGPQGGSIADPSGGVTIDVGARITIMQILNALRTHGLIAS